MAKKTFNTYRKAEIPEFDMTNPDGETMTFHMNGIVPGAILLDFISGANTEDPAAMARTVTSLLDSAIVPEELETWHAYIRDPKNAVDLETLSEVAGYASEVLSGGNPQPVTSSTG